jgi:hypothetical protein
MSIVHGDWNARHTVNALFSNTPKAVHPHHYNTHRQVELLAQRIEYARIKIKQLGMTDEELRSVSEFMKIFYRSQPPLNVSQKETFVNLLSKTKDYTVDEINLNTQLTKSFYECMASFDKSINTNLLWKHVGGGSSKPTVTRILKSIGAGLLTIFPLIVTSITGPCVAVFVILGVVTNFGGAMFGIGGAGEDLLDIADACAMETLDVLEMTLDLWKWTGVPEKTLDKIRPSVHNPAYGHWVDSLSRPSLHDILFRRAGGGAPKVTSSKTGKTRRSKILTGPRGGKYTLKNGRKVYLKI